MEPVNTAGVPRCDLVSGARSCQLPSVCYRNCVNERASASHAESCRSVATPLEPGSRYQREGNAGGVIGACEPPSLLALSWEFGRQTSGDAGVGKRGGRSVGGRRRLRVGRIPRFD